MKRLKNKRILLAIGVFFAAIAVAGTIAYNQDSMFFQNLFHLGSDVAEFSESFESPDGWVPCQEIPKTATATNKNATPRYVRMKLNEYWRTSDSGTSESDHETTDLPLTWNDNGTVKNYAVINTQNDDKWELRNDGWYYYKTPLNQDETTDSLLKSVTMNCDANVAGGVSYSQDGHTATNIESDYSGATYHLYVTFQMSGEEWEVAEEPQYQADCDSNYLYDKIACKTNGLDTDLDFTRAATRKIRNGKGVNTYAAKANEYYPVYYYRGAVDNSVIYANYCWKAIRTTTTGGVKLLYAGTPSDGLCPYKIESIGSSYDTKFNSFGDSFAAEGYMYGDSSIKNGRVSTDFNGRYNFTFSKNVIWDGQNYTLDPDSRVAIDYSDGKTREQITEILGDEYVFFCDIEGTTTCSSVKHRITSIGNQGIGDIEYIVLSNGDDLNSAEQKLFANEHDSLAKEKVDSWFELALRYGGIKENELEDTVFCNDRSVTSGVFNNYKENNENLTSFGPYTRNFSLSVLGKQGFGPSLDCPKKRDAFTKSDVINGNGALTYPVGLMTADEVVLGGMTPSYSWTNAGDLADDYLATNDYTAITMSPSYFSYINGGAIVFAWRTSLDGVLYINGNVFGINPVISLKKGAKFKSGGTGAWSRPYVIEGFD